MDVVSSSTEPFREFASILSSYSPPSSSAGPSSSKQHLSLDDLLDDQRGLGVRFAAVLEDLISSKISPTATEITTEEEIQSLSLELSAWKLVHSLYSDRLQPPPPTTSPQTLLASNPYTPPLTLIQHIISEDAELAEWVLVHRHFMTPDPWRSPFGLVERREGGWVASKAALKRGKLTSGGPRQKDLVQALDPDASIREIGLRGGGELASEDHNHALSLLPALFTYLRYGLAEECAALCRANDQSWLGASLVGGGSGWWVGGLNEKDEEGMDVEDQDIQTDLNEEEVGNRNRTMWKKIGWAVATNSKLPVYERALYGILTGYLPAVLPVCRSWEDHIWAHVNARIEARIDRRLKELGGFWADEFGVPELGEGEGEGARGSGLEDIFKAVMKTERDGVASAARDPYRMAMMYVILGRTNELFSQFAGSIPLIKETVNPYLYSQLLRFFAHLILYLRLSEQSPPVEYANIILQAYLDVLEKEGRSELVAVYAGSLGEKNAEESYSRFLKDMDPRVSRDEKEIALLRAKENGLDLVEVAKITVKLIMGKAFLTLPGLEHPEPDITAYDTHVVDGGKDWVLIRSLEWLTISEETFPEALVQANALVRYFLASGKVHAAKELLLQLPQELLDFSNEAVSAESEEDPLSSQASEYLQYMELFEVLGKLTRCVEMMTSKPRAGTLKIDQLEWQKKFTSLVDVAHSSTTDLLKSNWLLFALEGQNEDEQRSAELARVRHLFVPELVFRIHTLLLDTTDVMPQNLTKALELPVLLANEETKLYVEFIPLPNSNAHSRLSDYLDLVSKTSMACLEDRQAGAQGNVDPFKAPLSFAEVVAL